MLTIDGAAGEGGGQVLRSAISLALVTGRAVQIKNIRANRPKPGLLRQHLAAVRAAETIGAEIGGAELGSSEVTIRPRAVAPGAYRFVVGSAGSACLVLQTVLPPLLVAAAPSRLTIEGGTHNPFAPTADFVERVFLPLIARMGPRISMKLERVGFYPAGGGEIVVDIEPVGALKCLELIERGAIERISATARFAHLPDSIAERELEAVRRGFPREIADVVIRQDCTSPGPGNVVFVEAEFAEGREICTGFAERGVRAEKVARRAVDSMKQFLAAEVPVGRWLADQLMIPLGMAGGGRFRTLPLSRHSETNLEVLREFLDVKIEVRPGAGPGTNVDVVLSS